MGFALASLAQVSAFTMGEAEPSAKLEQHFEQYCLGLVPNPLLKGFAMWLHAIPLFAFLAVLA